MPLRELIFEGRNKNERKKELLYKPVFTFSPSVGIILLMAPFLSPGLAPNSRLPQGRKRLCARIAFGSSLQLKVAFLDLKCPRTQYLASPISRGSSSIIPSEMLTGPSLQWHQPAQVIITFITSWLPLLCAQQGSSCLGDRFVFIAKELFFFNSNQVYW